MYSIFISYAQAHLNWAVYLKTELGKVGASVYVAEYDLPAGSSLSREITDRIRSCDLFLLLWSGHSGQSSYVANEIFVAKEHNREIIPIILQPYPLPSILGDIKFMDVTKNTAEQVGSLKRQIDSAMTNKQQGQVIGWSLLGLLLFLIATSKE